jgi:hypothetical protein
MALVLKDRVKETTSTQGTGTITLLGAVQGYQAFSSIGNGNTTYYCIQGIADWEVGIGTVGAGTLTRDTVLASSNNGSLVGFGSGVKDVFCTYPASKSVNTDTLPVNGAYNTASPNDTVNVASLTSAVTTASGDIAIVPKSDGAILASVPDGTVTGGNKRGPKAVDLQTIRDVANEVASGDISVVVGGQGNRASGAYSFIGGGFGNIASTTTTTVVAGNQNVASGTSAFVGGGDFNEAQSTRAFVGGGYFNWANGSYSSNVGGYLNTASGAYSFIGGGLSHAANSAYSTISGGAYGSTRGVIGYQAFPACNAPIASVQGVSQGGLLILGRTTTSATSTVLRSNTSSASATNQIILPNNSAIYFRGSVIANVTGGGDTKSWTFDGQIKRGANAASTTLTGSTVSSPYADAGASTWTVALSADTTNGGLAVTVTGQASTTIRWVCKIETTEVTF